MQVSWATSQSDAAFLECLREAGGRAPVVAFGASTRWMLPALRLADHVLLGEPELALPCLCRRLAAGDRGLPQCIEAATLDPARHTPDGLISDLDALPLPMWDWVTTERYSHLSILSSRGCSVGCAWCPYVVAQGSAYRSCSPERTVAEVRELVTRYGARRILFRDPAMAHERERLERICHLIITHKALRPGKALVWECESSPTHFDAALVRLMSLAGCQAIKVGLETTGTEVLAGQHRIGHAQDTTAYLAQVADLARVCAEVGMALRLFVMVGLPGQTVEMAGETARFARAVRPAGLTVKHYQSYPGLLMDEITLPDAREVAAQEAPLLEAQRSIQQQAAPRASRWRRALQRAAYLALSRWHGGRL
jgi:radical SAM superfamily enzyme YgiQ (UPF0313 family)